MRISTLTKDESVEAAAEALIKQAAEDISIDVNNVTVSFKTSTGTYTAIKDISLTVQKARSYH